LAGKRVGLQADVPELRTSPRADQLEREEECAISRADAHEELRKLTAYREAGAPCG